jgi:putative component of membrane protein insertase Oxa1/YidC/SpoIIIJ protein YidD
MDRRLVQVKQCRSNPTVGDYIVRCLAKSMARSGTCLDISRRCLDACGHGARGPQSPRRIRRMHVARRNKFDPGVSRQRRSDRRPDEIGPPELPIGMAGALRDRLHGLPLVDRATTN